MGRRIGAFFIDVAIALFAFTIIFFPLATKRTVAETIDLPGCHRKLDDRSQVECTNRQVIQLGDTVYEAEGGPTFGLDILFSALYFAVLPGLAGATLGKLATGTRVVDANGAIANMGRSFVRWIVFLVDGPFSLFMCGLFTSLFSKGHRRLGDMAAGTFVVAKASVGRPVSIAAAAPQFATPQFAAAPAPYPAAAPAPYPASAQAPGNAPQWDAARGAYVQWDPASNRYLTWDQASQTWR
jgi:uncharacterized RDD family membrane protein YckC